MINIVLQIQAMNLGSIVKSSFFAGAIFSFIGAYLKITHREGADVFLILGIIGSLLFMATAIYEVRSSTRISHREKTMWTIAFLFLNGFAGFIYFFLGRRRIA
jgi:membrane protein CcdC involved in cytochrome C biogenesis